MNQQQEELWKKIVAFDFDAPMSEYSFSLRLAAENQWTQDFTAQAIKEYKKFMFIASQTDEMVSPSEIVDKVWHEHLVFTQSYHAFGELIGKQIQHVPSTHKRSEFTRFRGARVLTRGLYEGFFGGQPDTLWKHDNMFDSLGLPKAAWKVRTFVIAGLLAYPPLLLAGYLTLAPVYRQIHNPYFLIGWITISLLTLGILEISNRQYLQRTLRAFSTDCFLYSLSPYELLYLRSFNLKAPVLAAINKVLSSGNILYDEFQKKFRKANFGTWDSMEEFQVLESVGESGGVSVGALVNDLQGKPVFQNTCRSMIAFRKYFTKSKRFARIFYFNFCILSILLLLAGTRIVTGLSNHRPVGYLITAVTFFTIIILFFLLRLASQVNFQGIPDWYNKSINAENATTLDLAWLFYFHGPHILAAPLAEQYRRPWQNSSDGSGGADGSSGCGSSGSSCGGSSCGSGGCGGCGGD